jgi:NAD(P)-dependent dehydrogenase (short-subunit alcohol dehydrogenase family)
MRRADREVNTDVLHPKVAVLMNNAGIAENGNSWDGIENWKKVFDANLFGWVIVFFTRFGNFKSTSSH